MSKMKGDFYTRINKAVPYARKILANGVDPKANTTAVGNTIGDFVEQHGVGLDLLQTDEQIGQVMEFSEGAYILGVAVGLLLNPAVVFGQAASRRRGAR